tara:strand:- start:13368 stop:14738 length:1371 start_codon:yes stop_codon:yes gene_type:complete
MSDNLYFSRDTKVYIEILAANNSTSGSVIWEVPVLEGYSFSQAQNATEITLSEMESSTGVSRRGRRNFNDSYAPAEWSFSTYVRPFASSGFDSSNVHAVEEVLWGLFNGKAYWDNTANEFKSAASGTAYSAHSGTTAVFDLAQSNTAALGEANIYFALGANTASTHTDNVASGSAQTGTTITLDGAVAVANTIAAGDVMLFTGDSSGVTETATVVTGNTAGGTQITIAAAQGGGIAGGGAVTFQRAVTYKLENCVVNEASIDFDVDGIAQINWSGLGKIISEAIIPTPTITAGISLTSNYIRNRLTQLTITPADTTTFASSYTATLTGGNVTLSNNIEYLTPVTLGEVNQPFAAVAGSRNVGGNFTCYLNTGNDGSADLFRDLIDANTVITNNFDLKFGIGGAAGGSGPRLEIHCPTSHIELPTHSIEDVISLDTTFAALPSTISGADDATLTYRV